VHELKSHTYQSDALSANMQLNESHYKEFHTYRVEWEPPDANGTGGYIKWFTDGNLVFGIFGDSLDIMQTEIPSEPMYLLMNTAVSSHWGFPQPCPDNCDCKCFECGNPTCACALPPGYCDNYPANFEIDYVRVYQAVNEPRHFLGCSPQHRPTALFIEGHMKRYVVEGQSRPLQRIQVGGGACSKVSDCGGKARGDCTGSGSCNCFDGWVGPNCLSHDGYYDVDTSLQTEPLSCKWLAVACWDRTKCRLPIPDTHNSFLHHATEKSLDPCRDARGCIFLLNRRNCAEKVSGGNAVSKDPRCSCKSSKRPVCVHSRNGPKLIISASAQSLRSSAEEQGSHVLCYRRAPRRFMTLAYEQTAFVLLWCRYVPRAKTVATSVSELKTSV
jgi:Beta-glucan synthesis-associated protein SKN1/KRE6/Sbg1